MIFSVLLAPFSCLFNTEFAGSGASGCSKTWPHPPPIQTRFLLSPQLLSDGYSRLVSVVAGFFLGAGAAAVLGSGTVSSTMIFFTPWSITTCGPAGAAGAGAGVAAATRRGAA